MKLNLLRYNKRDKSSLKSHVNLRHNSEHVDAVISGTGGPQENRIFRFLNIHKKNRFLSKSKIFSSKVHCMKYSIRWENKNFDDMGTLKNSQPA